MDYLKMREPHRNKDGEYIIRDDASGLTVARVMPFNEDAEQIARQFFASGKMLEALKIVINQVEEAGEFDSDGLDHIAIDAVRTAIAAAKGGE